MSIELKYWDGRGLMEVPRILMALSGKFPPTDYTDQRFFRDGQVPSPGAKPYPEADGLEANLGRLPVVNVEGQGTIGQSAAINYYLAAKFGFNGKNEFEAAQILGIHEHIKEMMAAFGTIVPNYTEPTSEQLDTWFNTGAEDVTGTADMAKRPERRLKWWAGRIEAVLGDGGFAVGGALSLADVLLYNAFAEHLKDEDCHEHVPEMRKGPFSGAKGRTDAALENYPKLKAACASVAANPNMQKWLSTRGKQNS